MMAGGVFHVEFGINDTVLTRTLELGDHMAGERLIKDSTVPSYLDEGCYQRTPLFIVLCGLDSEETRAIPRNFYLARLLIEFGASINYRVPTTYFGSEYMGPGKTALDLLIDFHNDVTKHTANHNNSIWVLGEYQQAWDPRNEVVVGLDKQLLFNTQDVLDNIEDLIFILLSNGADPNLTDEYRMTCLHKTAIFSQDVRMLRLLADHGANVNATDCHSNTPLLSLCDVSLSDDCDYLDDLSPCSDDNPVDAGKPICVKTDFLHYFLSRKDVEVNAQNKLCQSPLFHCVIRGDAVSCLKLLRAGADPSLRGTVWETRRKKRKLSPLVVTFLSIPVQRSLSWQNTGEKLADAPKHFAHLVDAGYFTSKEITEEMMEIIEQNFPAFSHFASLGSQLTNMTFGCCSASLKQLSARVIFRNTLIHNSAYCLSKLLPSTNQLQEQLVSEDLNSLEGYDDHVSLVLNRTVLQSLIYRLRLPQNSLLNFEVELFLRRLACRVGSWKVVPRVADYGEDSDESFDSDYSDSSVSPNEGDSDLEYW